MSRPNASLITRLAVAPCLLLLWAGTLSPAIAATAITAPGAPQLLTITAGNRAVTLGFIQPASNGGSVLTGYLAKCQTGKSIRTVTGKTSPLKVSGLVNGSSYSCTVSAGNRKGYGSASAVLTATPATTPGAPTKLVAAQSSSILQLSFTAPSSNGGSAITEYTASCTSSGNTTLTGSATTSPIRLSPLKTASYTCKAYTRNSAGLSAASNAAIIKWTADTTPTPLPSSSFTLSSDAGMEGGEMASVYTCDGPGGNPAMTWSNPPAGTKEYAILMTTPTPEGSTKWNWVLWGIPASSSGISKGNFGIGYNGRGSDGAQLGYQAPCSQGTGTKSYTFTLYALSEAPAFDIPAANVTGDLLLAAISRTTLGKTSLNLKYTRTANSPGYSTPCKHISDSMKAGGSTSTSVGCDANYAYINSNGLPDHIMMDGIAATNLQVPTAQNFQGSNAWRIPLAPVFATTPTSAIDGPIGIAVNGVPIFNPCKQGGCQNGDTKVQGELDICNGHAGRADDYHYHAAPVCLMAKQTGSYWDTNPLGWALDGYAIMGYHGTDGKTAAPRDAICGGTDTLKLDNIPAGYSYHVTEQSPYILSCFRGVPSPDLAGQASKYAPMRQPPVTPFPISRMTLTTDSSDGYQVLQFTSTQSFVTTETGSDQYNNRPGTYRIRYKAVTGSALTALLAQNQNIGKTACWSFIFTDDLNGITQPGTSYCR